jgi:hypothetical protein
MLSFKKAELLTRVLKLMEQQPLSALISQLGSMLTLWLLIQWVRIWWLSHYEVTGFHNA